MIKVGNTWIAVSDIDPSFICTFFATAACRRHHHSQVAEHCTLRQNCMIVLVLVASNAVFLLLLLACTAVLSMPLLLLLDPLRPVDYCFVSIDFLFCSCCRCAKVTTNAPTAATYWCLLCHTVAATAVAGCFCPCHRHHHWLIVAILDWLSDLLFCHWSFANDAAMAIFQWCCNCSFRHQHPCAAHYTMVPVLLPLPVIAIAIATGWLLLLFVVYCCRCRCFIYLFAVALVACDAATTWLSAPFPCAVALLTPPLLLLVATSTIVAGCRLIVASFLQSLPALANAAATAYFCCYQLCCLLHHGVWRPLAVVASCCSCCYPYCHQ